MTYAISVASCTSILQELKIVTQEFQFIYLVFNLTNVEKSSKVVMIARASESVTNTIDLLIGQFIPIFCFVNFSNDLFDKSTNDILVVFSSGFLAFHLITSYVRLSISSISSSLITSSIQQGTERVLRYLVARN